MEAFGLVDELELYATNKGWLFFNGSDNYGNIEADQKVEVGQLALWINLTPEEGRAQGNRLNKISYVGQIALGRKFDSNYTTDTDHDTSANLDETFNQKHKRRLVELLNVLSLEMGIVSCANELQIVSSSYIYDINNFDSNYDFVAGTFNIEQESFTATDNEVDLTLTAGEGGTVQPYEGTQAQPKYSSVAINAIPDDGYDFVNWTFTNGQVITEELTTVMMNTAKDGLANFIKLFAFYGFSNLNTDKEVVNNYGDNAKIVGSYFETDGLSGLGRAFLNTIPYDWSTDGDKLEFTYYMNTGYSNFAMLNDDASNGSIRIYNSGIGIYFPTLTGGQQVFTPFIVPSENYYNVKIKTLSNEVVITYTEWDGMEFVNPQIKTVDLSLVNNLINTTSWSALLNGAGSGFIGKLLMANVQGHKFNFDSLLFNTTNITASSTLLYSSTTENSIVLLLPNINYSQDVHLSLLNGFTAIYTPEGGASTSRISIVPYNNGVSNVSNLLPLLAITDYYEEYPNNNLFLGYGIKMPISILPYDIDNILFDGGGNPNALNVQTLPTQYSDTIYFDYDSKLIEVYEVAFPKITMINIVGKNYLSVGDSEAALRFPQFIQLKTGALFSINSKGGHTFQQLYDAWLIDLTNDPTILDNVDLISIIAGANDYSQELTPTQCEDGLDSLIGLFNTYRKVDSKIILCGMYNSVSYETDPDAPNVGGLTFNIIRSIVSSKVVGDYFYTDWSTSGLISTDISDGTHAYTVSGGVKIANTMINTIKTITE